MKIASACFKHVKEVRTVHSTEEATSLLLTGEWIAMLAAPSKAGYQYAMGRIK